jgi:hypothetical protein
LATARDGTTKRVASSGFVVFRPDAHESAEITDSCVRGEAENARQIEIVGGQPKA